MFFHEGEFVLDVFDVEIFWVFKFTNAEAFVIKLDVPSFVILVG